MGDFTVFLVRRNGVHFKQCATHAFAEERLGTLEMAVKEEGNTSTNNSN
jgi:hypothetical protein